MKTARFYPFDQVPVPDSCWSLSVGPDGRIYASSCCEGTPGGGVFIVRYNEERDALETIVNVAEAVGEPLTSGRATQCKIHYSFAASPATGLLYAATLLAWDTKRDEVAWTDTFIPREGCRCLALDEERGRLYAVSCPRDHFWIYDLKSRKLRDLGRLGSINSQTIFTDRKGRVYTSNGEGQIVR